MLFLVLSAAVFAQTTAFSYQGRLSEAGSSVTGSRYFRFTLFDENGAAIPGATVDQTLTVTNGIFNTSLDFGAAAFPGANRTLQISVKINAGDAYTDLMPRQDILAAPYSIKSKEAENAAQLGGVDSSLFVQQDAGGNVSIAGNFTVNGSLSLNTVNAQTQYNLGGQRILTANPANQSLSLGLGAGSTVGNFNTFLGSLAGFSNSSGSSNVFVGDVAGYANTTGAGNSFVGSSAGANNSSGQLNSIFGYLAGRGNCSAPPCPATLTGNNNSFFGAQAGFSDTTGYDNAFFGQGAGQANTTGFENSFFGKSAGLQNTTGIENSFFGINAGINNTTGNFNTFLGAAAGTLNQNGIYNAFIGRRTGLANTSGSSNTFVGSSAGENNSTGNFNTFVGTAAGGGTCPLAPCALTLTGSHNSFFGVGAGGSNTSGANNVFLGATSGEANTTGANNTFVGTNSGAANVTGSENSFFGREAGRNNMASANSFFGSLAGRSNTSGANNTFVGVSAGLNNTTADFNTFVGTNSGFGNTTGFDNTFVGKDAGLTNTSGNYNSFFGRGAGQANVNGLGNSFIGGYAGNANTSGSGNTFFGLNSGLNNTSGSNNVAIGNVTGFANTTGNDNTFVGTFANSSAGNLTNATAIGFSAVVSQSNSLILGNGVNVGIGTSSPGFKLTVQTLPGNYGFTQTDGAITVGSYVGGSSSGATGGWLGTQSNNKLFFFTNNGQPAMTVDTTGNVGIGTITPASRFTVAGLIETTLGGVKFPDGTIQTSAFTGTSNSFIQNTTTQQTASNFNISGNGIIGGNLTFGGTLNGSGANLTNLDASNITTGTLNNARLGIIPFANGGTGLSTVGTNGNFLRSNGAAWTSSPILAADIPTNLTSYIQNTNTPQTGANFNIAGNGTVGGTLTANKVQATSDSFVLGNFGIGTAAPRAKLDVTGGNILVDSPGNGIILKSPDANTCRLLTIDNAGAIALTAVVCP